MMSATEKLLMKWKCDIALAPMDAKLATTHEAASSLSISVKHGFIERARVVDELQDQCTSTGAVAEFGEDIVTLAIATGLDRTEFKPPKPNGSNGHAPEPPAENSAPDPFGEVPADALPACDRQHEPPPADYWSPKLPADPSWSEPQSTAPHVAVGPSEPPPAEPRDYGFSAPIIDDHILGAPTAEPEPKAPLPPLKWLDMSSWDHEPRPTRQWAIPDRVPLRQVGLFSGEGGTGKSLTEMLKDVAHIIGAEWLGSRPVQGPAIYLGAEDDEDEIHIRFHDIAAHYGVTFEQLVAGGLHVLCQIGQDATLCYSPKSGRVQTTNLYKQIYEAAGDIKPKNISIDTLSRAFAGSEIDRVQVYGFANKMQAIARVANGSVTVLSHPSLQGIASGSGISGSTAWHGAFRFRQYLRGMKAEDGEQPDGDLRELEFKKNQYGPSGDSIVLRYQRGLFLPVAGAGAATSFDKLAREQKAEHVFLDLLRRFDNENRHVSEKKGPGYAPAAFAREEEARQAGITGKHFEGAMLRLFKAKKIGNRDYGKPSRPHWRIVRKETNVDFE
jgi:RecA-family ATPase